MLNQHRYQIKEKGMETVGSFMVHDCTSQTPVALEPLGLAYKCVLRIGPVSFVFGTPIQLQRFLDKLHNHSMALARDIEEDTFK